jgi:DNA topoisomerase-1
MRHLVIVESPSKCKTIERYLGPDYRVIATCGHFRGLHSLDQINRQTFDLTFQTTKPKIVKYLKEEVGIAKSVILATDDDREGEAIAWHICKLCKLPWTTPRIVFHEITKEAILKSMSSPTVVSIPRVTAQHTRQLLDVYIGFTISPLLWKAIKHTLSAGRCQTPALHMIAEQEERILTQSKDTTFKVKGYFTHKQIEFILEQNLTQEQIESFLSTIGTVPFKLEKGDTKDVTLLPPEILKTSTFQQKASQELHLSPKQIMNCAQILYENGLMTYMRTDQATYSEDFIKKAQEHLGNQFHIPRGKSSEGAHEGIRITNWDIKETNFDKQTDRVYAFLYKYTQNTCMKPTVLCHKLYKTLCNGLYFVHTSVSVREQGWKDIVEKDWSYYLDHLSTFVCDSIVAEEQLIHSEFHWSEAQLIRELEKHQIGRPSTYTHIVETLQEKKYVSLGKIHREPILLSQFVWKDNHVTKKQNVKEIDESHKLSLTPLGKEVNIFCYTHFDCLFNYSYSKEMEKQLDLIEEGQGNTIFLKETLDKIDVLKKVDIQLKSYPSLHAGTYRNHALILKEGIYGFYLQYNEQSISLKNFAFYDLIRVWIEEQSMPNEYVKELISFKEKNEHILLELNSEWSLRKGTYGPYLFYKTKKMKKPKFYSYPHGQTKEEIESYIQKNIKL